MATPIGETPILYGKVATDFLNHILDSPSKKQKELSKKNGRAKICSILILYYIQYEKFKWW